MGWVGAILGTFSGWRVSTPEATSIYGRYLWIRRPFRKQRIQSFVVTVDVVEKVHCPVLLGDSSLVENQDRDLLREVNLPIVFA